MSRKLPRVHGSPGELRPRVHAAGRSSENRPGGGWISTRAVPNRELEWRPGVTDSLTRKDGSRERIGPEPSGADRDGAVSRLRGGGDGHGPVLRRQRPRRHRGRRAGGLFRRFQGASRAPLAVMIPISSYPCSTHGSRQRLARERLTAEQKVRGDVGLRQRHPIMSRAQFLADCGLRAVNAAKQAQRCSEPSPAVRIRRLSA